MSVIKNVQFKSIHTLPSLALQTRAFYEFTMTIVRHVHPEKNHCNCSSVTLSHAMDICQYPIHMWHQTKMKLLNHICAITQHINMTTDHRIFILSYSIYYGLSNTTLYYQRCLIQQLTGRHVSVSRWPSSGPQELWLAGYMQRNIP